MTIEQTCNVNIQIGDFGHNWAKSAPLTLRLRLVVFCLRLILVLAENVRQLFWQRNPSA